MTPSLENYLETIYSISQNHPEVRLTDVSLEVGVAKASVNKAISVLREQEHIKQEKYGRLYLTESGLVIAKKIRHRHRTVFRFMTKILEIDPVTAEKEACLIEHVVCDDTIAKLYAYVDAIFPFPEDNTF